MSVPGLIESAVKNYKTNPDFQHPFYAAVTEMHEAGDGEAMLREKVGLKLLSLAPEAQEGFVLMDYPRC